MPNWKKVIVSGSDAVLGNITASNISASGDISASNFHGNFPGLDLQQVTDNGNVTTNIISASSFEGAFLNLNTPSNGTFPKINFENPTRFGTESMALIQAIPYAGSAQTGLQIFTYDNSILNPNEVKLTERITIGSSGNVGIGQPDPNSKKLEVSGSISASGNLFGDAPLNSDEFGPGVQLAVYITQSGQFKYTASSAVGSTPNLDKVTTVGNSTTNAITASSFNAIGTGPGSGYNISGNSVATSSITAKGDSLFFGNSENWADYTYGNQSDRVHNFKGSIFVTSGGGAVGAAGNITASGLITASGHLFASASQSTEPFGPGIQLAVYDTSSGEFMYTASSVLAGNLQTVTNNGSVTTNNITASNFLVSGSLNNSSSIILTSSLSANAAEEIEGGKIIINESGSGDMLLSTQYFSSAKGSPNPTIRLIPVKYGDTTVLLLNSTRSISLSQSLASPVIIDPNTGKATPGFGRDILEWGDSADWNSFKYGSANSQFHRFLGDITASGHLFASASQNTSPFSPGIQLAVYNTESGEFMYTASSAVGGSVSNLSLGTAEGKGVAGDNPTDLKLLNGSTTLSFVKVLAGPGIIITSSLYGTTNDPALEISSSGTFNLTQSIFVTENGNDVTGTIGDITKPFATLKSASLAATSGSTIFVYPGLYTVEANYNLAKEGVSYYFQPNSTVSKSTAGDMFDLTTFEESELGFNVYGYGDFILGSSAGSLLKSSAGVKFDYTFQARDIISDSTVGGAQAKIVDRFTNEDFTANWEFRNMSGSNCAGFSHGLNNVSGILNLTCDSIITKNACISTGNGYRVANIKAKLLKSSDTFALIWHGGGTAFNYMGVSLIVDEAIGTGGDDENLAYRFGSYGNIDIVGQATGIQIGQGTGVNAYEGTCNHLGRCFHLDVKAMDASAVYNGSHVSKVDMEGDGIININWIITQGGNTFNDYIKQSSGKALVNILGYQNYSNEIEITGGTFIGDGCWYSRYPLKEIKVSGGTFIWKGKYDAYVNSSATYGSMRHVIEQTGGTVKIQGTINFAGVFSSALPSKIVKYNGGKLILDGATLTTVNDAQGNPTPAIFPNANRDVHIFSGGVNYNQTGSNALLAASGSGFELTNILGGMIIEDADVE